jgi:hypothetical protein
LGNPEFILKPAGEIEFADGIPLFSRQTIEVNSFFLNHLDRLESCSLGEAKHTRDSHVLPAIAMEAWRERGAFQDIRE